MKVIVYKKCYIPKKITVIFVGILSILVLMTVGGCEHEPPTITASEAASLALDFGCDGMEDAEVLIVSDRQFDTEIQNGRAEKWSVELGSKSTGLKAELEVNADSTVFLNGFYYKHLFDRYPSYKPHDIPASAVASDEAWIENEISGRESIRRRCTEAVEYWIDSPEASAIASTHARKWYDDRKDEDFSGVYISQMSFYEDEWVVRFSPYRNGKAYSFVNVTLDPNGNLIEVERTHIRVS